MGRRRLSWWCAVVSACVSSAFSDAQAQLPEASSPIDDDVIVGADVTDIEELRLEDLLDRTVTTATLSGGTVRESPSVVTIVTSEEIRTRGLRSLADVLRTVPGFYDVYDLVTHNVGVRGVNGGARASGSVIKVMIDGQSVHLRSSTGNFFGPELIPMYAVDRVEIIRGPASALYGSNAFLGVVNVITRSGAGLSGLTLVGQAGLVADEPAWGGGVVVGGSAGPVEVLVAAHGMEIDRSGLAPPASSPILSRTRNPLVGGRSESLRDEASPRSFYARSSVALGDASRVSFAAAVQHLDASGEFVDFEPLTHRTRIAWVNQTYSLEYSLEPHDRYRASARLAYVESAPSDDERLSIGRSDIELRRNVRVTGVEGGLELAAGLGPLKITTGMDFTLEQHRLQTFDRVLLSDVRAIDGSLLRGAGTIIPGTAAGRERQLQNVGLFVQAIWDIAAAWSLTLGARLDHHNIYESNVSPRAAVVFAPEDVDYHAKLLFGSSFKAPSAEQLFTQPMRELDVQGNEDLEAQTARTVELAGGYRLGWGEILANAFLMDIDGLVEFTQRGLFLSADNVRDELIAGGELEARATMTEGLRARVGAGYARVVSSEALEDRVVIGVVDPEQPLFPTFQAHLLVEWELPVLQRFDLRVTPEVSYVSPRTASQSNVLENGSPYQLPAYVYTALTLSMRTPIATGSWIDLSLRGTNLLDEQHPEPGFGGIDLPSLGRTVFLQAAVTQGLL